MEEFSFEDLNKMDLSYLDRIDFLDEVRIVRFKGPIDKTTLPDMLRVRERIEETQDVNNLNILFDMKLVTNVDKSSVVRLVMRSAELQQESKMMGLINVPKQLSDLLDELKIETGSPITIYDSEEEAINTLDKN